MPRDEERIRRRDDDWDDDYDDRPRRRRDYDDYDDDYDDRSMRRRLRERSGAVTAVGVISIVLGSLLVLFGLCWFFGGVLTAGLAQEVRGNPGAGFLSIAGGLIIVLSLLTLLVASLMIVGGVGVLNRRNWARILTLVLAGISAILGLFFIFAMVQSLNTPFPDDRAAKVFFSLIGIFLALGYAVLDFAVLLNPAYAEEFEI